VKRVDLLDLGWLTRHLESDCRHNEIVTTSSATRGNEAPPFPAAPWSLDVLPAKPA
jgi:hypothetical protein